MNPRTMDPPKTLPSFALPSRELTPRSYRSRIAHGLFRSSSRRRSSSRCLACRFQYACTTYTPHRHAKRIRRKHPKNNRDVSLDPARDTASPESPIVGVGVDRVVVPEAAS